MRCGHVIGAISESLSMDRITQMVRWTGLLLAYLVLPLACLSLSKALGGERDEIGLASYYSLIRRTASGEPSDSNAVTGAHRTLPFGTKVRVTVLKTGKHVVVRINDRGPFSRGRVIDVSRRAAEILGMTGTGLARVRVEIVQ
jgi:rare lipoprotein A